MEKIIEEHGKTLIVFPLLWERCNPSFRVIWLFTGELDSQKDRTGFYRRIHTGQRTNLGRVWTAKLWKRTQLAKIRFGLIPEVCVFLKTRTDLSLISAAAGDECSKNHKGLKKEQFGVFWICLFAFLLRVRWEDWSHQSGYHRIKRKFCKFENHQKEVAFYEFGFLLSCAETWTE